LEAACSSRILIVDDDEVFLRFAAELLGLDGHRCDCVGDPESALGRLAQGGYELVIAGVRVFGRLELEFIRSLCRAVEGISVILVTGHPSFSSAVQSIHLPVVAYLVKPVESGELRRHVRVGIDRFRVYRSVMGLRDRLRDWDRNLVRIRDVLDVGKEDGFPLSLDTFLKLTVVNLSGVLLDLVYLVESVSVVKSGRQVCHLFSCPRLEELTRALVHAVGVLRKTKSSFRSKELGKLREELEEVLRNQGE